MPVLDVDQVPFFDAFLSYASADRSLVEPIAQRLADDRLDVFFDSWFIQPGQSIPRVLLAALRKSRKVVVLMTPGYFQSKWTEFELNWNFVETHLAEAGASAPMIPVLLRACNVPKEMRALHRIDLTGTDADAGFRALTTALSSVPSFTIESHAVPPGPASRYLGDFVATKLERFFEFPARRAREFVVVYGELIHNAFAHVPAADNRVDVTVRADADQVRLDVGDRGSGVDLAAHTRPTVASSSQEAPVLSGLRLAHALCESLSNEVRDGRHVVSAVLHRQRVRTMASFADILTLASLTDLPSSPGASGAARWLAERPGAGLHRLMDPGGRYAYLVIMMDRIDQPAAEKFRTLLAPYIEFNHGPFQRLILDLYNVDYISSAGLRVLMLAEKRLRAQGATLAVVCGPLMAEILEIAKYTVFLRIFRSRSEALQTLA
jgi:anti-anti-sigma factor